MELFAKNILSADDLSSGLDKPRIQQFHLHDTQFEMSSLEPGVFVQIVWKNGGRLHNDQKINFAPKQKHRFFASNQKKLFFTGSRSLAEILVIEYPKSWLDAAQDENSQLSDSDLALEMNIFSLDQESSWFDALLQRYCFERIVSSVSQKNCTHFLEKQIINQIFNLIFNQDEKRFKRNPKIDQDGSNSLACQARQLIESSIYENFSLDHLAGNLGISSQSLTRRFKKEFGKTTGQYHLEQRMTKAKQLLSSTRLTVLEIALILGYSDAVAFRHAFRRYFNHSPRSG